MKSNSLATKSSSKGPNSPVSEMISIHDLKGSISMGLSTTIPAMAASSSLEPCNISISIDDKSRHITNFDTNNNIIKKLKKVDDVHKINLSLIPEKEKKKISATNTINRTAIGKVVKEDTSNTNMSQVLRYTASITPLTSIIKSRNKVTIHKIGQVSLQSLGNGHARVLVEISLNPNCSFLLLDTLVLVSLQAFPNLKIPQAAQTKTSSAVKTPGKTPNSKLKQSSSLKQSEPSTRVKVRPHGIYNELTQVVMWQCGTLKAKDPPTQLHVIVDLGPESSENSSDPNNYAVPVIVKGKFQDAPLTSTLVIIDDEDEYLDVNIKYSNKVEYRFL